MSKLLTDSCQILKRKNFATAKLSLRHSFRVFAVVLILLGLVPHAFASGRLRQIDHVANPSKNKIKAKSKRTVGTPTRSQQTAAANGSISAGAGRSQPAGPSPVTLIELPASPQIGLTPSQAEPLFTTSGSNGTATPGSEILTPPQVYVPGYVTPEGVPVPAIMSEETRLKRGAANLTDGPAPPMPVMASDALQEKRASTPASGGDMPGVGIREPFEDPAMHCLKGSNYYLPQEGATTCQDGNKLSITLPGGTKTRICPVVKAAAQMQGSVILTRNGTNYIYRYDGRVERVQPGCNTTTGAWGECLIPFISVAADPAYYTAGDIIDVPELAGTPIPTPDNRGTMPHPGYFIVADTGSKIKGQHRFDFFIGMNNWMSRDNPFGPHGVQLNDATRCVKGYDKIQSDSPKAAEVNATIEALVNSNGGNYHSNSHGGTR